MMIDTLHE
jgi:hypothetical protein